MDSNTTDPSGQPFPPVGAGTRADVKVSRPDEVTVSDSNHLMLPRDCSEPDVFNVWAARGSRH